MKTYCKPKQVNIESAEFNRKAVYKCLKKKLDRGDFRKLLAKTSKATKQELCEEHESRVYDKTFDAIDQLVIDLTADIVNRDLHLPAVRQFTKTEGLDGKTRDICQESAKQQVHEYILVGALKPLFRAKFLPFQYGSIPGKGPEAGKRRIERLLRKKFKAGKVDVIQGDVKKAYPSTTTELILRLLKRDIGKIKALLWYAGAVMENYPGGVLLIGGYFSAYAFNYVMSYVLRYLLSLERSRRGKPVKQVLAVVCYADDFTIYGRISQLEKAMKKATLWAASTLGLNIKKSWKLIRLQGFSAEKDQKRSRKAGSLKRTVAVDMMGHAVRGTYTIIRKRIFRRLRRQLLRAWAELQRLGYVPWWRGMKLTSYKGRIKYSDSHRLSRRYNVKTIMLAAERSISMHAKKGAKKHETAICNPA